MCGGMSAGCIVKPQWIGTSLNSPLHSMCRCVGQVNNQGIQLQGNPTGGGESHLFIKPNLRLGDDQVP